MRILALDPAEMFGWAVTTNPGEVLKCGCWNFKLKRDEAYAMKLIRFRAKLLQKIEEERIELVAFERCTGRMPAALMSHAKFVGVIEVCCTELNLPFVGFSAKTLKKFATGNGNAKKLDMIKSAIKKLGYRGKDDNAADALWVLEMAKNECK